ncbi:hypothetical protein EJ04DRAFT_158461 [Polyplosphaeria fusca]|uniref:alpha-galactosidase n=1 Tax=Polyplosphaeria fusca TaxID=682080 RepID=A0A9P4QIE9_9PLEO|nr:hypothetical protein EJ04DRAFT_158461 [Polyplosphaeria fusca]
MRPLPILSSLLGSIAIANAVPTGDLPLSEPVEAKRLGSRQTYNYWKPPMRSNIQFILTGIPDVDEDYIRPNAGIYEVDMFYTPAETILKMNELGQKVICYFSAATAENWRDDYSQFQRQDLGLQLPDWPGERYLDIRRANVFNVIKKRIDLAKSKGCNAIEPDNTSTPTTTASPPSSPPPTPSPTSTKSPNTPAPPACPSASKTASRSWATSSTTSTSPSASNVSSTKTAPPTPTSRPRLPPVKPQNPFSRSSTSTTRTAGAGAMWELR